MTKPRTALIAGTVLFLGLLTGCGGGDESAGKEATGPASPYASASAAKSLAYPGDPIPGLSAKPAWSIAQKTDGYQWCAGDAALASDKQGQDGICAVGDAFLLVEDLSAPVAEGETDPQTAHFVGHLYDAATGKERKAFTVECTYDPSVSDAPGRDAQVQVGTWKDGSPAVLIRSCENTEASGLKKAAVKTVYTMYAPNGTKLGSSTYTDEEHAGLPVVRGHVLLPGEDDEDRTLAPIGGGKDLVLPAKFAEADPVGTGQGYTVEGDGRNEPLSVIDRSTGKSLWTTTDLTPPTDVVAQIEDEEEPDAELYALHGDQGILVWSASGSNDAVITTVDLRTGATLAVGPRTTLKEFDQVDVPVVSPDGKTAVVNFAGEAVAWNTATGAELWRQEADEKEIRPVAVTAGGVLFAELESNQGALSMATKSLMGLLPQGADAPTQFTTNGYTLIPADNTLFAFAATKP
ncbi:MULTISPECIES: PQQ-binding-like beta-propeller repeat protein [unclassified Streptomyces]|uniref:outer membrane protein assembly factor BamB family protein n=1 Tax=unclassified Streptomyces TaxID=2593676 RepID=UPI0037F66767